MTPMMRSSSGIYAPWRITCLGQKQEVPRTSLVLFLVLIHSPERWEEEEMGTG